MTLDQLIEGLRELREIKSGNTPVVVEVETTDGRRFALTSNVGFVTVIPADKRPRPHLFRATTNHLDEKGVERILAVFVH